MKPVFVDEIIADCVSKTSVKLLTQLQVADPNITGVHFMHGSYFEILDQLKTLATGITTKNLRYPLVALFRDFPEVNGNLIGVYSQPVLNIIIAVRTDPKYSSDQRKEKSFKPIIYPILFELLSQIQKSGKFMIKGQDRLNYTQIDHYFWGKQSIYGQTANLFNDFIDCTELQNFKLNVYAQGNCGKN